MNIVHVVESLAVGGLERVVVSLASWQRGQGDVSRIICLFHEGALAAEARANDVEVVAIGKAQGLDLRALRTLRAALHASGADVLHTHNAVAHYYAAAAAVGLGIGRVINTRHGMGTGQGAGRLDRLYRAALVGTDAAVAVCQAGLDRFVQAGVIPLAKARVVPNGVPAAGIAVRSAPARARLMAQLGRPESSVVLGIVGRLNPVKDHATLLKAVHLLHLSGRRVELVIAGDGETRHALETLTHALNLDECVHLLGMRQDVAQLLSAFDIFVLSSISEGYSLALVEAAAAALPIVATRVGGNAEIVADGTTGLLVPAKDSDSLAGALARLVDDVALRERLGNSGRQWALQNGTVEAMGQAYLDLYRRQPAGVVRRRVAPGQSTSPQADA